MTERRKPKLTRSDVFPVVAAHVGPIVGHTEYTGAGVAVFVPPTAPRPDRLDAAAAGLEARGCAVTVEDLGEADSRGRWRVTATEPDWRIDALSGCTASTAAPEARRPGGPYRGTVTRSPGAGPMPAPRGAPGPTRTRAPGGPPPSGAAKARPPGHPAEAVTVGADGAAESPRRAPEVTERSG